MRCAGRTQAITQALDKHLIGNERARGDGEDDPLGVLVRWVITDPKTRQWHEKLNKLEQDQGSDPENAGWPGLSVDRVTGIEPALSAWELQGSWLVEPLSCG
ncbi:hypothetical protein ACIBO2_54190 [Nonomuraea sp. NPDC050022]|uniref:hypothetical protein n=1 Tax=unclassified Nonomuraea TaxID=2593643 RepID=UPI0033D1F236